MRAKPIPCGSWLLPIRADPWARLDRSRGPHSLQAGKGKTYGRGSDIRAPDAPELKDLTRRRDKPLNAVIYAVGNERIINAGLPMLWLARSLCVYRVVGEPKITIVKDTGPVNFNLFMRQWPTPKAEAAAQEALIEWIRAGRLSSDDFLWAEFPVRKAARALSAAEKPTAIKKLLRF